MDQAPLVDHLRNVDRTGRCALVHQIGPIGERTREMRLAGRIEETKTVADRKTKFLAVDAGRRSYNIHRRVRDQRRMMICK